jgi:transcriptional regulator of heat shock response
MILTSRQADILKAIIEEYMESAVPIASVELVERRQIPLSGATVRNVMADLVKNGFLSMVHVSSGRTPTYLAYRYYVDDLMQEEPVSLIEEVAIKNKINDNRKENFALLKNAVSALCESTNYLAFGLTEDGFTAFSGSSKVLNLPEFYEIDVAKAVFTLIDDGDKLIEIVRNHQMDDDVSVIIGDEIGLPNMQNVSIIFSKTKLNSVNCYLGLIAPARTKYYKDIPLVRYLAETIENISKSDS